MTELGFRKSDSAKNGLESDLSQEAIAQEKRCGSE